MSNYFYYYKDAEYPKDKYARPHHAYPEYPFSGEGLSVETNDVYEMIRAIFIELELDKENYNTVKWNPLGMYIKPGDKVLLKPNLVKHENEADKSLEGLTCMVTHPSIIKCVIDYVLIALKGQGKIIVADAPVQGCDFGALMERGGYRFLEEFYQKVGYSIQFEDLRSHYGVAENGVLKGVDQKPKWRGIEINLSKESYFYKGLDKQAENRNKRLRITNYNHKELYKHHSGLTHEYCISEAALKADVIINLPKPKCHRKAGYTGGLKNFVGVNTSKEYLPHHTKGSYIGKKGDEFYTDALLSKINSNYCDISDSFEAKGQYLFSRISTFIYKVLRRLVGNQRKDAFQEGSWWGNDTVWRMVLDINYIINYGNKIGQIQKEQQRKILYLGDMIICGEKEGPLMPSPKKVGGILFADNGVHFDRIAIKLMGFNENKLPVIFNAKKDERLSENRTEELFVKSNNQSFSGRIQDLKTNFAFEPSEGYKGVIENEE